MQNSHDNEFNADEEEEILVYANFEEGTVDKEMLQQGNYRFKIIGLESDTPILQLGDTTFKGFWNDTIGTKVLFEEDPSPEQVDPVFTVLPSKMLKYKCMTTKALELSRIFLKPKVLENNSSNDAAVTLNSYVTESIGDEHQELLNLAQSTINPDMNTDNVMNEIVNESVMEGTE